MNFGPLREATPIAESIAEKGFRGSESAPDGLSWNPRPFKSDPAVARASKPPASSMLLAGVRDALAVAASIGRAQPRIAVELDRRPLGIVRGLLLEKYPNRSFLDFRAVSHCFAHCSTLLNCGASGKVGTVHSAVWR